MEPTSFFPPQQIGAEDLTSPHSDDVFLGAGHDGSHLSPEDLKHDYNFSGVYDSSSAQSGQEDTTDDELARLHGPSATSSRSSISSLPASVAASAFIPPPDTITPTKSLIEAHEVRKSPSTYTRSPRTNGDREYGSPFRHASSVIAMQMRDDDAFSLINRRRDSQLTGRISNFSGRSSITSSPSKHGRGRSSPQKQSKTKKEYPLVLLHCTLLPPTISIPNATAHPHLLQTVLPDIYWRRWKLLNDKIAENSEVKTRGVLIPHPKNDYELLEEKLLESLELVRPRIRSGHYLGSEDVASVYESDDDTAAPGVPCPDCGSQVQVSEEDKRWEIKVYAANGLMRAGAWSAAWSEMEKIDVEVGVFLPEDVRRDIENSLLDAIKASEPEEVGDYQSERDREVYGTTGRPSPTQDEIDGLNDMEEIQKHWTRTAEQPEQHTEYVQHTEKPPQVPLVVTQPSLPDMMASYVRNILDDKKSAVIIFLSVLVIWFAFMAAPASQPNLFGESMANPVANPTTELTTEPVSSVVVSETVTSISIVTTVTTTTALETVTATEIATATATLTAISPELSPELEPELVPELDPDSVPDIETTVAVDAETDETMEMT